MNSLQVRQPTPSSFIMGVRYIIAGSRPLPTNFTYFRHDKHSFYAFFHHRPDIRRDEYSNTCSLNDLRTFLHNVFPEEWQDIFNDVPTNIFQSKFFHKTVSLPSLQQNRKLFTPSFNSKTSSLPNEKTLLLVLAAIFPPVFLYPCIL
jgi:hypothetical protein